MHRLTYTTYAKASHSYEQICLFHLHTYIKGTEHHAKNLHKENIAAASTAQKI